MLVDEVAVVSIVRQEIERWHQRKQTNGVVSGLDPLTVRLNSGADVHITHRDIGVNPQVGDFVGVEDTGTGYRLHQPLVTAGTTGDTNRGDIPIGGIIMWSGAVASIPEGWALCDGSGTTPDLRDRFVIGAGSTYSPGDTGGSDGHTHSAGTHTHFNGSLGTDATGTHNHGGSTDGGVAQRRGVTEAGTNNENFASHSHGISNSSAHSHNVTGDTGIQSFTVPIGTGDTGILPPYYAIAYIMRIV